MSSLRDRLYGAIRDSGPGPTVNAATDAAMVVYLSELAAKDTEIEQLRGLLDELRRRPDSWCSHQHITMTRFAEVVAEKLNAVGQRDEATEYARQMINEREQAEAAIERVRAEIARWSRNTLMPQTARALDDIRAALDQPEDE